MDEPPNVDRGAMQSEGVISMGASGIYLLLANTDMRNKQINLQCDRYYQCGCCCCSTKSLLDFLSLTRFLIYPCLKSYVC